MNTNKLTSAVLGGVLLFGATACGEMSSEISELWNRVEVPEGVKTQFASLYPDVKNPDWDEEDAGFEAEFELGGRERSVLFSPSGQLLQVEEEIAANSLPPQVLAYMQQYFDKYTVDESSLVKEGGTTRYVVELEHRNQEVELTFDQSGNLIEQTGGGTAPAAAADVQEASLIHAIGGSDANANAFAKPEASWELPAELREVSGIALLPGERMACVQDEKGIIFIYNLESQKLEEQYPFGGPGDYEGLAVDGSTAYVLRSDGTVFEVRDFMSQKPQVRQFKSVLAGSQNTEGLALDKANNRLLLACKGHDKALGQNKGIYEISLENGKMNPDPVITIPLAQEPLQASSGKSKKDGYDVLQPSSLEIHPQTGVYYMLDAVNNRIMVLKENGSISSVVPLDKKALRQAEGLAFADNGDAYIASEGSKKGKAVILKYKTAL
ncbi:PepSY-like domain-containing protein [Pontibacter litorisediminis]|uniref:PepSY-like domain-containing protein n=1 Tax=Pontibacter litorisediminis TaxID=1846260 RepID=UPI0023EB9E1E|nr:PepSY-like domain-containing protein [Pontibacter litorisediminis]